MAIWPDSGGRSGMGKELKDFLFSAGGFFLSDRGCSMGGEAGETRKDTGDWIHAGRDPGGQLVSQREVFPMDLRMMCGE